MSEDDQRRLTQETGRGGRAASAGGVAVAGWIDRANSVDTSSPARWLCYFCTLPSAHSMVP